MNAIIWNIRGVGGNTSQQQLWYLINLYKSDLVVLLDPLVPMDVFKFCTRFKMDKVISNCSNKIWILSKPDFEVEILEDHRQYLHCKVTSSKLHCSVLFTAVYAKCTRVERQELWRGIRNIAGTSIPWAIGGDFSIIAEVAEADGGAAPNINAINDFGSCIMDSGLVDVGYQGHPFTWEWDGVQKRLDRILFNHD